MKAKERQDAIGGTIEISGIEYKIAEKNKPNCIRIYASKKATKSQIKEIANALSEYDRIDLCTESKHERGDEYGAIMGKTYINYLTGEISELK